MLTRLLKKSRFCETFFVKNLFKFKLNKLNLLIINILQSCNSKSIIKLYSIFEILKQLNYASF